MKITGVLSVCGVLGPEGRPSLVVSPSPSVARGEAPVLSVERRGSEETRGPVAQSHMAAVSVGAELRTCGLAPEP